MSFRLIRRLHVPNGHLVRPPVAQSLTAAANPLIPRISYEKPRFSDANHFFSQPQADPNILPQTYLDIRGVDQYAYKLLRTAGRLSKATTLANNDYVSVKFFPAYHFISAMRKSAVAYAYFNSALPMLNSPVLEKAVVGYSGKYKKNLFFNVRVNPLSTAVGRAKFKKLVKRQLFECIQQHPSEHVKGLYFFVFKKVPVSDDDKQRLQASLLQGITQLATDPGFQKRIRAATTAQTKNDATSRTFAKHVKFYNSTGAQNVPGYTPKLPFIKAPRSGPR